MPLALRGLEVGCNAARRRSPGFFKSIVGRGNGRCRKSAPSEHAIRVITAPYFGATKLEALHGRGKDDFFSSHDLEDVITVMDGRQNLIEEIQGSAAEVRAYIGKECAELLGNSRFPDALPGYVLPDEISQGRIKGLLSLLERLAQLK